MREWIVTNGLGGYASLTHQNANTRKFHGLLIASLNPPTERWVFVSNVFDHIQFGDYSCHLNDIKGKFMFDLFPSFSYKIEGANIKKTILMEHGKNTTIIKYEVNTKKPITIVHSPVINSRHFYDVTSQRALSVKKNVFESGVYVKPDNTDKTLTIILKDSSYKPLHYWEEFYYHKDRERNDSWIDNNIHIGDFSKKIDQSDTYYLILTLEDRCDDPAIICEKESERKKQLLSQAALPKKFEKLVLSTDNFTVKKGDGKSIIAGYHWFGDWGRDTLIALPGTTLVTKRFNDARQILLGFSKYCKNGLIPNVFMDRDSVAVYNTVDASLWFVDRVYQYLRYTNDGAFLDCIWGTLESIINGYKNGTDYDIHMDDDFLISHGPGLTWMDVKLGDYYQTPRDRKAVEIQALWYNSLRIMSNLSQITDKNDDYCDLAENVKEGFNRQFDQQYDVIDTKDLSVRPNQIFLASLDFSMINEQMQEKIVKDVKDKLITIFGLRTLSPDDSRYKGNYIGEHHRDLSYHNGVVWPWLLGPFIKAFVKTKDHEKKWRTYAHEIFLKPMFNVFGKQWDGSIHEIFDGDPVYAPRGCITQAWSVAEILRAWVEDIEEIRPSYEKTLLHEIRI